MLADMPSPTTTHHTLDIPYDVAFETLLENLHLRWDWGFFFTDSYIEEDDRYVYTVIGVTKINSSSDGTNRQFGFVVKIKQDSKSRALVSISTHYLDYSGWPSAQGSKPVGHSEHGKIVDKLLEYCQVPHGEGRGFTDVFRRMMRTVLGRPSERRKR